MFGKRPKTKQWFEFMHTQRDGWEGGDVFKAMFEEIAGFCTKFSDENLAKIQKELKDHDTKVQYA